MGCFSFLKVMMILFNLAIFLGGGTLLGVGIWVAVDGSSFSSIFGSSNALQFVNISYFLIIIGAILVVLGFLGCCGAQKESKCLLIMFFSIVLIIFIAEVAAAVVALVYTSLAENILQSTVTPTLKNQYGKVTEVTQIWNTTMSKVKCCGLMNYTDFTDSYYYKKHGNMYPPFCCKPVNDLCNEIGAHNSSIPGCFEQLLSDIRKNADVVGGVAAGICVLEIAAMVVSMYLYCQLDKK
ncbi:tetraspanin-1 [Dermochelys coriacea]|uniref:tetraspanin-1 n=1 Tax=Dermochelys coriacea TaxID=27794 RepID=UPI0018E83486|nr:tetraspanin-1 [Dermochelys coriacea]XP_038270942.1 tetraspanin-1 [Dermochelys coriacea]